MAAPAADGRVAFAIPPRAAERAYAVLRVHAVRGGEYAPRPFEVHVAGGRRIVGLRH
jgi:hypothetical protein